MMNKKVSVKIIGKNVFYMYDVVRNKVTFLKDIQGVSLSRITDGELGKFVLPDGYSGYRNDIIFGKYYLLELQDGSSVKITPDEATNSLIFDFNAKEDRILGMSETVINYIDYNYERD